MSADFHLLMISAMYENGGNTTHRLLDGHPQMFVYPFESQLGTRLVNDHLTSLFPVKYRWPEFGLADSPEQDYEAIIDEECKVRTRTASVSKFRHVALELQDAARKERFVQRVAAGPRSRGSNVAAFFQATFDVWQNCRRTGEETTYVGYSPIIGVDADKILSDLPGAHMLHVVRDPCAAYADTKKRPVPMSLERYLTAWVVVQYHALLFQTLFPGKMHVVRYEDIIADPVRQLGAICERIGLRAADTLSTPSWNGERLPEVYPWGTIRRPTPEANRATAAELTDGERAEIRVRARPFLQALGYE